MPTQNNWRKWAPLGALMIVLVVAGVALWKMGVFDKYGKNEEPARVSPKEKYGYTEYETGKVVAGFPENLLKGGTTTQITESFSTKYATSSVQYTVKYSTEVRMSDIVKQYFEDLRKGGYTIVSETADEDNIPNHLSIQGKKVGSIVNIAIAERVNSTTNTPITFVVISYGQEQ